uniref:TRAFD1/XAF1 zinc finger domain-containing protein n=1 Tax=Strigamia maritima TaxID=126957 RepID=T1J2R2_STRMM
MADETQQCPNCKKEISEKNFTMHVLHCQRNFSVCKRCNDVFPVNELKEHLETAHKKIKCHQCNEELENYKIEDHDACCPKRLVQCLYCELDVFCDELNEHESYCGSRTELCAVCNQYIMLRDQRTHEAAGHPPVDKKTNTNNNRFSPLRNDITADNLLSIPINYTKKTNVDSDLYGTRQSPSKRNNDMPQVNTSFPVDWKKPEKTSISDAEADSESQANIDRLIAYQFQEMDDDAAPGLGGFVHQALFSDGVRPTSPLPSDFFSRNSDYVWNNEPDDDFFNPNPDVLNHENILPRIRNASGTDTFIPEDGLPCEFCGELYPADLLIQHESGCCPDIAHGFRPEDCIDDHQPKQTLFEPISKITKNEITVIMLVCKHCLESFPEEILLQHEELCPKNPEIAAEEFLRDLNSPTVPPKPPPRRFSDVSVNSTKSKVHQCPSSVASSKPVNQGTKPPADRNFSEIFPSANRSRSNRHDSLAPANRISQVSSTPNPNVNSFNAAVYPKYGLDAAQHGANAATSTLAANLPRPLPYWEKDYGENKNTNVTKPKSSSSFLQDMKHNLRRTSDPSNLVTGAKPKSSSESPKPDSSKGNKIWAPVRQQAAEKNSGNYVPTYCKSNDGRLEDAYHRFLVQRRAQYGANNPQRSSLQPRLKQTGAVPKTTKKSSSEE